MTKDFFDLLLAFGLFNPQPNNPQPESESYSAIAPKDGVFAVSEISKVN